MEPAVPAKSITDAFVRNVRPPQKPKQDTYIDTIERGFGLMLIVSYGGSKTFRVLTYDATGRAITRKIGRYPNMTLKDARAKAREYFENPEKAEAEAETGTFADVADAWFADHVVGGGRRSAPEIRRHLTKYIYPRWKHLPFIEIRRRAITILLDEIAKKNGRPQADAVLATIRGICNWYQARSEFYVTPIVVGMKKDKRSANERQGDRVLDDDEIVAVWEACDELGGRFAGIVKLALLTGQRRAKVMSIKWSDISDDGTWTIATEDREKGNAGVVKLPQMALDVIEAQPRFVDNPFVFAAQTRKTKYGYFNSWGERKADLDELLARDMPHWKIHDLRRTARTLMARAGVADHIAKLASGHTLGGMDQIYNRFDYLEEKSDALARVASLIDKIINPPPANVIEMRNLSKTTEK